MLLEKPKLPHIKKLLLTGATIALIATIGQLSKLSTSSAISNFDPGNIMSDFVMSNKDSMTVQQIQTFLDSKNPCNNTDIHMATLYSHLHYNIQNGKFVCMAQESFNGKSAAQIIWQAAQDYHINPQVLIVLLQKEQGLITDTWPNHIQYRSATGFGCPDTAACDSQYHGFENQVRQAANLFRTVLNGGWSNYQVGDNYVQYNPSSACGGSVINIKNRATSALYRYTPYQPNAATLAAKPGDEVPCGAYGNLNFYRDFTNWFGSTQSDLPYEQMETIRFMRIKNDTKKVDLKNMSRTNQILEKGRDLKFVSKITIDNVVYLRTAYDTSAKINYGIPMSELEEIEYIDLEKPIYKILPQNTTKYNPIDPDMRSFNIYSNLAVKFVQKITVNNQTYLRTAFDQTYHNNLAILQKDLKEIEFKPFIDPRFMRLARNSNKIHLHADAPKEEGFTKDQQFMFTSKVSIGRKTYYRTKTDTQKNLLFVFDASDLVENKTEKLQYHVAYRIKAGQNKYTSTDLTKIEEFPVGMVRFMTDRIFVDNNWYYRTEWDQERNNLLFFKDSGLEVVFDPMETPRMMRASNKVNFIDLDSGLPVSINPQSLGCSTQAQNITCMFTTKAYTSHGACLRTKEHTKTGKNICILFSDLINVK